MPEALNQTNAAGDGSVRYFLLIDGFDGGSTAQGYEAAFDVSSASFGAESEGTATSFSALDLTLTPGSSSDELIRLLATGQQVAKVQLVEARQSGSGAWVTVNDYRFGDAQLSAFGFNESGVSTLSLAYDEFQQTVGGETFGWDTAADKALDTPIGAPATTIENPVAQFSNVEWFLTIEGVDGGGENGAFEISGFDFDMLASIASGGGGSGKASFDPVSVDLELGSAADEILDLLASGKILKAAQIVGLASGGSRTAYDLRFTEVTVTTADISSKGTDAIGLAFNAFSLTTIDKTGAPETVSFNLKSNTTGTTALTAPTALSEDTLGGGHASWQMVIDGLNGGGRDNDFFGAFDIVNFSFGGTNSLQPGSGSGSGSGKVDFSDLSVTFGAGSALDELMELLALGQHLERGVRITGDVTADGRTHGDGFDLRLNDATVTGITQLANGNVTVAFGYGAYSLTTENADGDREISGWNLSSNTKVTTELVGAVGSEESFVDGPDKNSDFYLVIEGLDGGAGAKGRAFAFDVSSFAFDATAAASSGGGGGSVGKADFSALTMELDIGTAAARLLERWRNDSAFSAQLVGIDGSQKGSPVIYDLRLDGATVAGMEQNGTGSDVLTLDYDRFSIATGKGASREVFGFDRDENAAIDELDAPAGTDQSASAGQKMDYSLVIDGLDGGGPKGAFVIDDFFFELPGKEDEAGTISFTLDIGSAADELMQAISLGRSISLARLIGDETGQAGFDAAYDLRLGRVFISDLQQNDDGKDVLTLIYDQASLSTKDSKGRVTTQAVDVSDRDDPGLLLPATAGKEDGQGGVEMNYWLTIDGLNSGSKTKGHVGEFSLDGLDFDMSTESTISGSGAAVGKPIFEAISVLLEAGYASNELLALLTDDAGSAASISIVGEATKGSRKGEKFLEIRLETVEISQFSQDDDDDGLSLSYDAVSVTTWNARGKSETYGFDVKDGVILDHTIAAPTVGDL